MRSGAKNLRFLDDMVKVASGAMQSMGDVRGQVKSLARTLLGEMDLVSREEFERVEALAQKARERQVELEKRFAALEKRLKPTTGKKKK